VASIDTDAGRIGSADLIILFVKAYDTESAICAAGHAVSEKSAVVTLQNGLGNIEAIQSAVPGDQIVAGTTAHGATMLGDGRIRHAGVGETVIGPVGNCPDEKLQKICTLFRKAGINTSVSQDICSVLWGKLIINAGINPVTAVMNVKNGTIPRNRHLCAVMHSLVDEVRSVAVKMNIALPFGDPRKKVADVCRATAENVSSMLQDIRAGRKTEIDNINGAVVEYGKTAGVATPVNSMFTGLVHALEKQHLQ